MSFHLRSLLFLLLMAAPSCFAATAVDYYAAGVKYYQQKDVANAARYFQAAVQLDKNHAGAWRGLGNCYYAAGKKHIALSCYEKSLAVSPEDATLKAFIQRLRSEVGPVAVIVKEGEAAPVGTTAVEKWRRICLRLGAGFYYVRPGDYRTAAGDVLQSITGMFSTYAQSEEPIGGGGGLAELGYRIHPDWEFGVAWQYVPDLGTFSTETGSVPPETPWRRRTQLDASGMGFGLTVRYLLGSERSPLRPYLGAGGSYYSVELEAAFTDEVPFPDTRDLRGTFKSHAYGGRVHGGVDIRIVKGLFFNLDVFYQMAEMSRFTGSVHDLALGSSSSGELAFVRDPATGLSSIRFKETGVSLPDSRPLEYPFSGPCGVVRLGILF